MYILSAVKTSLSTPSGSYVSQPKYSVVQYFLLILPILRSYVTFKKYRRLYTDNIYVTSNNLYSVLEYLPIVATHKYLLNMMLTDHRIVFKLHGHTYIV